MGLSIDWSRVIDNEFCVIPEGERDRSGEWMNPITKALGFGMMFIGMREITEKNAAEFYARMRAYELISGALLTTPDGDRPITPKDVSRHIGLSINGLEESDAAFRKKLWRLRMSGASIRKRERQ
jgi:hypothetical protein